MTSFLQGGGECGAIIRRLDWSTHPLGPPEGWPAALKLVIRLILESRHPMHVWWGPNLFGFHNDAFSRCIGADRRPSSMGRPGRGVWAENWDVVAPQIDVVMGGGGATWQEEQCVPITRNGAREHLWWTYGISPIDDPQAPNGVGGVLVVCNDVTKDVLEKRRGRVLLEIESVARDKTGRAELANVCGILGRELRADSVVLGAVVDGEYVKLLSASGFAGPGVEGQYPLKDHGPELAAQLLAGETILLGDVAGGAAQDVCGPVTGRAAMIVPIRRSDQTLAVLIAVASEARPWTAFDAELVAAAGARIWQSYERTRAEDSLAASEERHRLASQAFNGYVFDWDPSSGHVKRTDGVEALFGYAPDEIEDSVEWWRRQLHPDDASRTSEVLKLVDEGACRFEAELRIRRKDGEWLWVADRGAVVRDAQGRPRRIVGTTINISEQKRAQQALAESRERLELALAGTKDGLWDWDVVSGEVHHSPRFAEQLGYTADEWESTYGNWIAHMHPDDVGPTEALLKSYLSGEVEEYAPTFRMRHKDGSWRWMLSRARAFRNAQGQITRMAGAHTDVTAQREAEIALVESEAYLSTLLDALPIGVVAVDATGKFLRNSAVHRALWGPFPETNSLADYVRWVGYRPHTDERLTPAEWPLARVLSNGEVVRDELVEIQNFGTGLRRNILVNAAPVRDGSGKLIGAVATQTDVTVRIAKEAALRASEAQMKLFVDRAPAAIAMFDRDMRYVAASRRYLADYQLHGEPNDLLGQCHYDVLPDLPDRWRELHARALAGEILSEDAAPFQRSDGRTDYVRWELVPWRAEDHGIGGVIFFSEVITEQIAAQQALRDLNSTLERRVTEALAGRRLWADIVEASDALILVLDHGFRILAANGAQVDEFHRAYGLPMKVGDNLLDLLGAHPEQRALAAENWGRALNGEHVLFHDAFGDETLSKRCYELKLSPLRDGDGRLIGACQIAYDVTERVRQQDMLAEAQRQLFEAQKMETIGQLTGGIAHDFNNLLAAILSTLDLARKRVSDPRAAYLIEGALQGAQRGAALTQRLLAFARRQDLKAKPVSVPSLFDGMKDLLARSLGGSVRIAADFPHDLPAVNVDPNQLELALLNLAVNARDAMPLGGSLNFSARTENVDDANHMNGLSPGNYVRIDVADTGQGMDEVTCKRATEPFFTTKGVGKGTGLGLPMVLGLAAQSGGAFGIHSVPGEGTTVSLWLPRADGEASMEAPRANGQCADEIGPLTVLVVDDDALVSMGTVALLEDLGHSAIEAHGGRRALEIIAQRPDIDLVLTDHAMPGMTGVQLAEQLGVLKPDLPIILATGHAELPNRLDPGLPRLSKPFSQNELATMIAAVSRVQAFDRKVTPLKPPRASPRTSTDG